MLNAVISWSLRHRFAVILLWLGVAAAGVLAFRRLPLDAFPDTTPVQVQVNTVAAALSPLEIERQITGPVEQVISGLPGLSEVRSLSRFGLSQVTVTFRDGTDIYLARQVVSERLGAADLPEGTERPQLGPVATGLGEVFHYLVTGGTKTLAELRTAQDWIIKPQLRSVPGVAEVNGWGGDERQLEVVVDPTDLRKHDLTLAQLIDAIESNNLNVGGGTLDLAGESRLLQGKGSINRPEDLEKVVVAAHEGIPVRVSDVARVIEGREIRRAAVTADGKGEAVLGLGFMLMGENSHQVTESLAVRLAEIRKTLPEGIEVTPVYERTWLVDRVLHTVRNNLIEGAMLVIAVLFALLGSLRAGLIVAVAIPFSMLFAFDLMTRVGIAGSLMSLGAIDFGLVVDSSVIMIENAVRRLSHEHSDRTRVEVVRDAAIEVRRPTMFGELIILIVYLPILALEGIEGKLFRPMALTVVFALLGSMMLSLTLMPVLASLFLPRHPSEREGFLIRGMKFVYRPILRFALRWRVAVLLTVVVIVANAAFLATRLGAEFVPRLREGSLVINTIRASGVSVDESVRYGTQIEQVLLERFPDEIERIWTRTGTPEVATDPMGVELSDVFVTLRPTEEWTHAKTQEKLVVAMKATLAVLPGMRASFLQPIEMRVNEMIAGVRSDLGVKLFGDDLEVLKTKAREIEGILKSLPGAADVSVEQVTGQPVVEVEVDRDAAARHGIPAREILAFVEAVGGRKVGELREGDRRFPIAVRIDTRYRVDEETLGSITVTAANGDQIPLSSLTTIHAGEGPSTINREWGKRRIVVQTNIRGRDVASFVAEAKARIDAEVALPEGWFVRFGGQFEHLEAASERLMIVVPVALLLIFGLLYLTYGRILDAARVFTGVPFAAVGGVVALWLRDIPFSISAGVGFVALSGVAVLGDMVLVSTIRQLIDEGKALGEAVLEAADRRLRPVVMTALVAALGFLPMAVNTGVGAEVQRPLATVVIGGIVSSTLLTLIVLPVLYTVLSKRRSLVPAAVVVAALVLLSAPALAVAPLSLADAERTALERSPAMSEARARVEAAKARVTTASVFPHNPEVGAEAGRRSGAGGASLDWGIRLGQTFEIGGQTGLRGDATRAGQAAAESDFAASRALLIARVRLAYLEAVRARELVRLERDQAALAQELAGAANRRWAAGASTALDRNVARAEVGRAQARVRTAEGAYGVARSALAETLGLPGEESPQPGEPLELPAAEGGLSLPALLRQAHEHRAEITALDAARKAAELGIAAARAEAMPDVGLGAFLRREAGTETILGGELTVPLPIFERNQGGIAESDAATHRVDAEGAAVRLRIDQEVVAAAVAFEAARATAETLQTDVVGVLDENARLVVEAAEAGKVAASEVLLMRQQARDASRELLEAVVETNRARVRLDLATGALVRAEGAL